MSKIKTGLVLLCSTPALASKQKDSCLPEGFLDGGKKLYNGCTLVKTHKTDSNVKARDEVKCCDILEGLDIAIELVGKCPSPEEWNTKNIDKMSDAELKDHCAKVYIHEEPTLRTQQPNILQQMVTDMKERKKQGLKEVIGIIHGFDDFRANIEQIRAQLDSLLLSCIEAYRAYESKKCTTYKALKFFGKMNGTAKKAYKTRQIGKNELKAYYDDRVAELQAFVQTLLVDTPIFDKIMKTTIELKKYFDEKKDLEAEFVSAWKKAADGVWQLTKCAIVMWTAGAGSFDYIFEGKDGIKSMNLKALGDDIAKIMDAINAGAEACGIMCVGEQLNKLREAFVGVKAKCMSMTIKPKFRVVNEMREKTSGIKELSEMLVEIRPAVLMVGSFPALNKCMKEFTECIATEILRFPNALAAILQPNPISRFQRDVLRRLEILEGNGDDGRRRLISRMVRETERMNRKCQI